jgi:hypothetical protein
MSTIEHLTLTELGAHLHAIADGLHARRAESVSLSCALLHLRRAADDMEQAAEDDAGAAPDGLASLQRQLIQRSAAAADAESAPDVAAVALSAVRFMLEHEADRSMIAPAFRRSLLDALAPSRA